MKTDRINVKKFPDKDAAFPNPGIPSLCYIKNVVKNPRIIIGDYTYYDDIDGADLFESHVTHFYDFIGDRLIIGNFCAIARGVNFIMNGANHRMDCATTYPFYIMGGEWVAQLLRSRMNCRSKVIPLSATMCGSDRT